MGLYLMVIILTPSLPNDCLTCLNLGVSIGWATKKLPIEGDSATFGLELPGARPGKTFGCTIGVQYDGPFNCDALTNWVLREQQKGITVEALVNYAQDQEVLLCLKFINSLLRKECTERFVSGQGAKSTTFFDKSRDGNTSLTLNSTQGVIEAWRGFYQTASARFGQITVNVDTATATFIKPGINFIDAISKFSGVRQEDLERGFDGNRERILEAAKKFSGVGFRVKHLKKGSKGEVSRRGFRLTRLSAEEDTFQIRIWSTDDEGNKTFTLEDISIAEVPLTPSPSDTILLTFRLVLFPPIQHQAEVSEASHSRNQKGGQISP